KTSKRTAASRLPALSRESQPLLSFPSARDPAPCSGRPPFAESLAFFLRHVRLEHLDHAAAADDARQGQRDAKLLLIAADRNDRVLVIEHHLGDPGRYDADSELAGIMALDDADVGVAPLSLQLMLQLANPLAAPLEQCRHWNSSDPCRGPQEH